MIKKLSLALVVAVLHLAGPAHAGQPSQLNAEDLLNAAQQSLAYVVSVSRADAALSADDASNKPYWDGLQDTGTNLEQAKTALAARDDKFFTAMASANAGYVQAEIALLMNGNSNPKIASGMKSLGGTLETLGENYSREAARLKQGGELTAAEQAQLDKLIAQQDELMKKLDEVEKNVAKNNAEMKAGIEKIRKESQKIRRSRSNVGGFVGGFFAAHYVYDWIWGWHWWWGPWGGWCPGYIDIGIIVWDDWSAGLVYDWDIVDDYIDVAELEYELLELDDALYDESLSYLDDGDFGFDGDMGELTQELEFGWDDVYTDTGMELVEQVEENLDVSAIYERSAPVETFEDYGIDDFGGADFGGDLEFGFDDW